MDGETLLYRRPTVDDAQAHRPYECYFAGASLRHVSKDSAAG
jgi:hypothetical protein